MLHRADSLVCTLKKSNHLRSHSRAIMALDHSRLGLVKKFLENKSGRIFCVRQVYFTKSCQQIWGRVNQPFILFIHHIWGKTVLRGAVFIIQTSDRMQYFTIFNKNCTYSIFWPGRSKHEWAVSETAKNFSKSAIRPAGFDLWSVWMNINRVTLQHNKEFIMFLFYLVVL